jgi:integrase/recombinase XerD
VLYTVTVLPGSVTQGAQQAPARAGPAAGRRPRCWPTETLTEAEALALLRACSRRAPTGIRNRTLIATLWRCGLRIGEALALELRDVDRYRGTIRVRHGKGDEARVVGVDEQTAALLGRWIDWRRAVKRREGAGLNGPAARASPNRRSPDIRRQHGNLDQ